MSRVNAWLVVGGEIFVFLLIGLRFRRVGRFFAYLFLGLPLVVLIDAISKSNEISSTDVLFSAIYAVLLILYLIQDSLL